MSARKKQTAWRGPARVAALATAAAILAAITPFASELVGAVAFVLALLAVCLVPRPTKTKKRPARRKSAPRKRKSRAKPASATPDAPAL